LLHFHYRRFNTTTIWSATACRIDNRLVSSFTCWFSFASAYSTPLFRIATPGKDHATFIPDTAKTGKQVTIPTHLINANPAAFDSTAVFDVFTYFSILHRWLICIRLLYPHLTGYVSCLFLLRSPPRILARSSGRRFADSACTASAEVQSSCLSVRSQATQFARLPHSHNRCSRAFHVPTQHHRLSCIAGVQGTRQIGK
jgi:hypothetical protein